MYHKNGNEEHESYKKLTNISPLTAAAALDMGCKCHTQTHTQKVRYYHPPPSISTRHTHTHTHTHTLAHTFNGPLSRTTRVNRYQKGETNLHFIETRDSEWYWHQLGHMQVCISLQTDNHASTPPLILLQAGCPSCRPNNSVNSLNSTQYLTNTQNLHGSQLHQTMEAGKGVTQRRRGVAFGNRIQLHRLYHDW